MPELGILRGVITLLTLLAFLGICWWAYRPGNRARFEEDGLLAFGEDEGLSEAVVEPHESRKGVDE